MEVRAVGHCYLHRHLADVTTTHLIFPGGVNAHIFVSWLHPFKEQKLVVVGADGMAVFDDAQPWGRKLSVYSHRIRWENGCPVPVKAEPTHVPVEPREPLAEECAHFLSCIASRKRPRTDAAEAIRVLRVLARAEENIGRPSSPKDSTLRAGSWFAHETAVVDPGVSIGDGTKIWHFSHVLRGSRIGRDCVIGQNVMIGPDVIIGDGCKIQNNVSIYRGVTLEDAVFCGPSCVFTNVVNPRAEIDRKSEFRPTVVRRGATIGANATIVCGVELGEYCFVGAGAVVTKDVPPHALVVGNPARQIGWVSRAGERLGPDLTCPRTGERYAERDGRLVRVAREETAHSPERAS